MLAHLLTAALAAGAAPAEPAIVLYDLTPLRALDLADAAARRDLWDTCHLAAALQGLVNRDAPRLYVHWIDPADRYWLMWLRAPGRWLANRGLEEIKTLDALLGRFKSFYRGVVLYAEEPHSLSNLASTIAGAENLLPVRKDARPGALYTRIVQGGPRLPVVVDLTRQSFPAVAGSRKCDPYLWAKDRFLASGACDPRYLAYYIDSFWLREPFGGNHENHKIGRAHV